MTTTLGETDHLPNLVYTPRPCATFTTTEAMVRAIVAEQREHGRWGMENEGQTIATALPTDKFFVGWA
ncbi:hypothetical protein [Corynebacterium sp.]|uniref:hypothetical protein n=1 Tax=Corynebacterium sp. TaxID=1720 RepID=UPI00290700BB|nr:hypothetical protein [Corynebacterium sp.]MDU4569353.1 hypothetical protein [Corynebacterium sp.]